MLVNIWRLYSRYAVYYKYNITDLESEVLIETSEMKLLVFYLYFAKIKGSGPAFMRILSYIDFYNQFESFKVKNIWSEMAHKDNFNDMCL